LLYEQQHSCTVNLSELKRIFTIYETLGREKKKKIDRYSVETIAAIEKKKKENETEGALVVIDTIVGVLLSILSKEYYYFLCSFIRDKVG